MSAESTDQHPNPLSAVTSKAKSDIGLRREENQDSFGIVEHENYRLFVVCDGMGGVKGGAIASALAVSTIKEHFESRHVLTQEDICEAVSKANTAIFQQGAADSSLTGMGTTFVALGFFGTQMFVSSVGDSRAYRIRGTELTQLTEDHTLVHELLRSGAINEEQAGNHPVSHMLTRSLGPAPTTEVDCTLWPDGPQRGDVYLLCSDGLYNMIGPEEIAEIMHSLPPEEAVEELVSLANLRGGVDNITVIIISIGDQYPVGPARPVEEVPEQKSEEDIQAERVKMEEENPQVSSTVKLNRQAPEAAATEPSPEEPQPQAVPEQESATTSAQPEEKPARRAAALSISPRSLLITMLVGFPIALGSGYFIRSWQGDASRFQPIAVEAQPAQPEFELAQVKTQDSTLLSVALPSVRIPELSLQATHGLGATDSGGEVQAGDELSIQHPSESERITQRKDELRAQISDLEEKIASFDRPISGRLAENLKETTARMEELERAVDNVRAKIDVATRALTIWYGRKKRLQGSDPINLASEVAISSEMVKLRKERFEQATYAYLKEAEVLRYNPSDQAQERRVRELARSRSEAMRDLIEGTRTAIDAEVSNADKTIAEFTLKRERAESDLEQLRRTVEYVKILMGNDSRAKELKKSELQRGLEVAKAELEELELLSPNTPLNESDSSHSDALTE